MKQPRKGIRSTRHCPLEPSTDVHDSPNDVAIIPIAEANNGSDSSFLDAIPETHVTIIKSNDYSANIFVYAAFADKHTGILYSDLT
jgi:hypothetical protein